ncbi:MAG TPA: hypothetical protein VMP11_11950 [Verrucomicrobiae bacterium]|nr:hypothetical protein [Verrucomicrobiae bacterium]
MPYALLQKSLDQTIGRGTLEDAAAASKSIPRPDCARLQKELFGILVQDLEYEPARALQRELFARNFPTEVVDQSQLPVLNEPASGQEFQLESDAFVVNDLYGAVVRYPWDQFVFAAAGYVLRLVDRPHVRMWEVERDPFASRHAPVKHPIDYKLENVPQFRIEFFFAVEPYRFRWCWDSETIIRVNQDPVRFSQREKLASLLQQLAGFLPPERLNSGIRKLTAGGYFTYPGVHAFEEEIIWSFYQLMRQSA